MRGADDALTSTRISQPRPLALLCYLALARPRGLHSRDLLLALLWPEHDDVRARRGLRNALHEIRLRLGSEAVVSAGDGLIGLNFDLFKCDALDLESGVWTSPADSVEPLNGFHVADAGGFTKWLDGERDRLRSLIARATTQGRLSAPFGSESSDRASNAHASQPTTHTPDVFALYQRGHYLFLRAAPGGSPNDLRRSREYFERALVLNENFAPALAGLANFYAVAARREMIGPFRETFAKTIEYSKQALALDPTLAIPHVHFAVEAWYLQDDIDRAGDEFSRAVGNEPSYAEARRFYGVWLGFVNRVDEALIQMEAAARLEPDIPHILSSLAAAKIGVNDLAGAERVLRHTLDLDARHGAARTRLISLLESQERYEEAVSERQQLGTTNSVRYQTAWRADGAEGYRAVAFEETRERARAIEARLVERAPPTVADIFAPPVVQLVSLCLQLGDDKRAHAWQLQACAERPALARWFASLPELRRRP